MIDNKQPKMFRRPRPYWNVLSVFAPFLGIACAFSVLFLGDYFFQQHPAHFLKHGAMTLGVFLVFGFVSACIALIRSERFWGITVLAMVLNSPFVLIAVAAPWDWPF